MTAHDFTLVFVIFLAFSTALQIWLKTRQLRHVLANRERIPNDFATAISLADHQKAADYTAAKVRFGRVAIIWDALLLLGFTLGGGIGWLDRVASLFTGHDLFSGVLLVACVSVVAGILGMPFSIYSTFVIEQRFGFNKMTPLLYLLDMVKNTLLGAIIGLPLVVLVLWLLKVAGAFWWLYAWGAWVAFGLALMAIYPTVIAPIFNRFQPLDNPDLKARIDALLTRCGFRSNGVFVMDGSRRSSHGNAYFTGFGKTKRIVFFDTLIERLQPLEVEAVLAHELGHFKRRHVIKRMIAMYVLALVTMAILGGVMGQGWFYAGLGVATPSNAAALILFFLALGTFTFPFSWLASYLSRRHEYEADRYAAEVSDGKALVSGLVKLYRDNASTTTPDPLHSLFYDSHPPAALRIAALRAIDSA